ncbi:hypothetical protein Ddye_030443 [Dipteronia dyeriana]|uniref:Uncharacterized protein n=1 Tax=Dipteronia dyeriana TaxID=168575 RepID=A0AAD9TGP7_9ROSI|nr:hypothetical protein Ddye_030443 [Dipteronia dyeriana]
MKIVSKKQPLFLNFSNNSWTIVGKMTVSCQVINPKSTLRSHSKTNRLGPAVWFHALVIGCDGKVVTGCRFCIYANVGAIGGQRRRKKCRSVTSCGDGQQWRMSGGPWAGELQVWEVLGVYVVWLGPPSVYEFGPWGANL